MKVPSCSSTITTSKDSSIKAWAVLNIVIFGCSLLIFTAGCCFLYSLDDPYIDSDAKLPPKPKPNSSATTTDSLPPPTYSEVIAEGLMAAISPYYPDYYFAYDGVQLLKIILIVGSVFSAVGIIAGIILILAHDTAVPYYIWMGFQLSEILAFLILGVYIVESYQKNVLILACQFFLVPCPFLIWSLLGVAWELLQGGKVQDPSTSNQLEAVNPTDESPENVSISKSTMSKPK